jgi:two-component system OmpR family response regulator
MRMQILLIDTGARATSQLLLAIANAGHAVLGAHRGTAAVEIAAACTCDALVVASAGVDTRLQQLVRQLKAVNGKTPLVVVVEQAAAGEVAGLIDDGADDVLFRAAGVTTLLAHVTAMVRRAHGHLRSRIAIGALEVHIGSARCRLAGRDIHLTPMEFRLIEALALRRDQLVARTRLLEILYGNDNEPFAKSIDRFVHNIRNKFCGVTRDKYLQTFNKAFMLTDRPLVGNAG